MASSGTYSFAPSNGELVLAAFERIQVRAPELRQEHMVTARREMNFLLASFANLQVNLWKVELFSTPLINGQQAYDVSPRVVLILDAWVRSVSGGASNDRYVTPISRTQWASFNNKTQPGQPTCYWFDRLIAPTLTPWPVQNQSGVSTLYYYAAVQMQDSNLYNGQTPDVPYVWLDAIVAGLAYRLSKTYAPALEDKRKIDAKEAWDIAAATNTENVNLSLAPPISNYYRR